MTENGGLPHEQVMDMVAKLLAKAESTTPEEAQALTERAEQIMAKYSIDVAVLNARRASRGEKVDEKITRWTFEFHGTYHRGLLYTFEMIGSALGFKTSFQRGPNWSALTIMGFESDVEMGQLLLTSLQLQLTSALTAWWKEYDGKSYMTPMQKFKARRSFMFSFGEGVSYRIYTRQRAALAEAEESTPGATLAVRDRGQLVQDAYDALNIKSVKVKIEMTDVNAEMEGYEAGRNADIGDSRVTSGKTAITS